MSNGRILCWQEEQLAAPTLLEEFFSKWRGISFWKRTGNSCYRLAPGRTDTAMNGLSPSIGQTTVRQRRKSLFLRYDVDHVRAGGCTTKTLLLDLAIGLWSLFRSKHPFGWKLPLQTEDCDKWVSIFLHCYFKILPPACLLWQAGNAAQTRSSECLRRQRSE